MIQRLALAYLGSGWDRLMEHPLWTAGSFCGDGRPAGMGDVWVAEQGAYTGTLYQHQAEERQETARTQRQQREKYINFFGQFVQQHLCM